MKKKINLLGVLLLVVGGAFAQTAHADFGLKGGLNVANFNTGSWSSRAGVNVGALIHTHLSPHFALQPEIVYSQQGAKLNTNQVQKLNYINIPLLGQYMFGGGARLETGPQVGFLANSTWKNGNNETHNTGSCKNADFAWAFGAGYLFPGGVGIDARYNLGLTDITHNNSNVSNRVWQVGLFYQFK